MITLQCTSCQQVFEVAGFGNYVCPFCRTVNDSRPPKNISPWEEGWKTGTVHSFVETVKGVLFSPVKFFGSLAVSPRLLPVVVFGVVAQSVGGLAVFGYQALLSLLQPAFLGMIFQSLKLEDLIGGLITPLFFGFMVILLPLFSFVGIVFSAALYHFMLWILKGANNGINATVNAICYSMSAQIAMVIPIFGAFAAGFWQLALLIIGIKELHGISYGKSVLALLLPMCLCSLFVLFCLGLIAAIFVPILIQGI